MGDVAAAWVRKAFKIRRNVSEPPDDDSRREDEVGEALCEDVAVSRAVNVC